MAFLIFNRKKLKNENIQLGFDLERVVNERNMYRDENHHEFNEKLLNKTYTLEAESEKISALNNDLEAQVARLKSKIQAIEDTRDGKRTSRAIENNKKISEKNNDLYEDNKDLKEKIKELNAQIKRLNSEIKDLSRRPIDTSSSEIAALRSDALAKAEKIRIKAEKNEKESQELMDTAIDTSKKIISNAEDSAKKIAGDAYIALKKANELSLVLDDIVNSINGYGDVYLKPTFGYLDELAEKYQYTDAGKELEKAKKASSLLASTGHASHSNSPNKKQNQALKEFILTAFNGRVDSILSMVKTKNHGTLEQQIKEVFAAMNWHGEDLSKTEVSRAYLELRLDELKWAVAVQEHAKLASAEQKELKEKIREEEKVKRELEKAMAQAAKEEAAVAKAVQALQAKMDEAKAKLTEEGDAQRAELEAQMQALQDKLHEAEEKNKRTLSMAQQTKAGHVYIISNIGSFGENVYKIGMTRRLDPMDRVKELGDASVPFGFDVHALIWSDDAPALEHALHVEFMRNQVNKINPRKEFFKLNLSDLRSSLEKRNIDARWTMESEAQEFRETQILEREILSNKDSERQWLTSQSRFDPTIHGEDEDKES